MADTTKRPDAPLKLANEVEHRRQIAIRANVGLPIDGSRAMNAPLVLDEYTNSGLPAAALWDYGLAYDTDHQTPVYSDGVNWMGLSMLGIPSDGSNNSTDTLSGGATFTGTAEQNNFPDVMVSCFSDTAGTLYFDFSVDGTNWRTFPSSGFSVSAGIHEFHTAVKGPRYFRVRFVNGASAQSTFQLYTYFGSFRQPNAPLNQPLGLDADALLVRPTFPWLDISRGLTTGLTDTKKFGRNTAVGTSFVPICLGGIYQTPQAASATTLRIKAGGNANDTAAGSGAREITLIGLDENWNEVSETIATAGASASSATTATFTRLYRAYVSQSGTYATASAGSHSADIVIENGAGGTDWATITSTGFPVSQSEIGAYTVPTGYTGYAFLNSVTIDTGKTSDLIFFQRAGCDDTAAPYQAMRAQSVLTGLQNDGLPVLGGRQVPLGPFTGPCDLGFMGKVSTGTGSIAVEFEIFLVQE